MEVSGCPAAAAAPSLPLPLPLLLPLAGHSHVCFISRRLRFFRRRAMVPLAQQLLACGAALQGGPSFCARFRQLTAALIMLTVTARALETSQLGTAAAAGLASCVGLLLGAGRTCLLQMIALQRTSQLTPGLTSQLQGNVMGQAELMRVLFDAARGAGVGSQLAGEFAAPPAVTSWLAALAEAAEACWGTNATQGEGGRRRHADAV